MVQALSAMDPLATFLTKHSRKNEQQPSAQTHTWFAAGPSSQATWTLHVPEPEIPEMNKLLVEAGAVKSGSNSITEKLSRDVPFRFAVDIDLHAEDIKTWATKHGYSGGAILENLVKELKLIVHLCKDTVVQLTATAAPQMILATRLPYKIHLHFPSVIVDAKNAKVLVSAFRERFKQERPELFTKDVVDASIYTTGLRLLYCHKGSMMKAEKRQSEKRTHEELCGSGSYSDVYYVTDASTWVQDRVPTVQDLKRTSVLLRANESQVLTTVTAVKVKKVRAEKRSLDKGKGKVRSALSSTSATISELDPVDQHFFDLTGQMCDETVVQGIADSFSISREDIRYADRSLRENRLIIPTRCRVCPFAEREHRGNQLYLVVSNGLAKLRCHDEDCRDSSQEIALTKSIMVASGSSSRKQDLVDMSLTKRNEFLAKHVPAVQKRFPPMNMEIDPATIVRSNLCGDGYMVPLNNNHYCGICQKEHDEPKNCLMMLLREQRLICRDTMNFESFPMGEDYSQVIFANVVNNQVNINVTNTNSVDTNEARDFGSVNDFPEVHHERDLDRLCFASLSGRTRDVAEYVSRLMKGRYLYQSKLWYRFTGKYWRESVGPDDLMTKDMVETYMGLQRHFTSDKHRKWIFGLIDDLANVNRRKAYLEDLERYEFEHSDTVALDGRPELTGFQNGVYDSSDCSLRAHRADDLLTKLIPYDIGKSDPAVRVQIEKMIHDMIPDDEVRDFLMLVLSLHLEGVNRHDIAMIWTGVGGNGKSLLKSLMKETFVDFHKEPPATFLTNERPSSDRPCSDLMDLRDAKSVFTSEPQAGKKTNSGFLKFITGRDPVRIRNVHSSVYTEYTPRFLVTLLCNEIPLFDGGEDDIRGIWRRVKIIHFGSIFTSNPNPGRASEKLKDVTLEARVKEWGPEFMLMLMERFQQYVDTGRELHIPAAVAKSLEEQKEVNCPFDSWFNEHLIEKPGNQIHIHRFERMYKRALRMGLEGIPLKAMTVENKLKIRGYQILAKKNRDSGCACATSNKLVVGLDIKDWTPDMYYG